ncbi:hopanoid biosynthesis associated protein HpnK [Tistlia consotensis]|uniref:Hopanoid biosynthesis associated protein HpnK n=2 Tax=Tistlia TaxID=1321364 RepID=A0A1Y6BCY0_9PROT|nr:hopanoid biosynthesis associated protein HpnK [Tistlia consotensis USBA 355]SNR29273.1 hopanoid biosynthesis associated protein HpnK [Tistlia consotensis]
MVAEPAAADAVARARRLPSLRVGLHVVAVDGAPLLPPEQVPALVGTDGRFPTNLAGAGVRIFFDPAARRQLKAEVRAQFEAFAATGLPLDHVNAHHHYHLHPTLLATILEVGRSFGMKALRLPAEPSGPVFLRPWIALMRRRLRRAGLAHNDWLLGLSATGRMTEATTLELIGRVPRQGVSELYFHPVAERPGSAGELELRALTAPAVAAALARAGLQPAGFAELAG